MTRYAALLRAVNVGGRILDMRALRDLMVALGFTDARTYIQSGNIVFSADAQEEDALATRVETSIAGQLGVPTRVLLRSAAELAAVVERHPFAQAGTDTKKLFVTFLSGAPGRERVAALSPPAGETARFRVIGREVYSYYPDGYGRSKVALPFFERGLGVVGTARGWNTVAKLAELLHS